MPRTALVGVAAPWSPPLKSRRCRSATPNLLSMPSPTSSSLGAPPHEFRRSSSVMSLLGRSRRRIADAPKQSLTALLVSPAADAVGSVPRPWSPWSSSFSPHGCSRCLEVTDSSAAVALQSPSSPMPPLQQPNPCGSLENSRPGSCLS